MFYVTSTKYVGPNHDQNADTAVMEITTEAPRTNLSHEVRTEGWLGTTNDWSENAHGEFDTLEAARAFVEEHMDGDYRDEEVDSYEAEHGIVARFKYGAYEKMSAEASVGWLRDGDDGVTVDMTDEQIEALVQDCDQEMHRVDQGFQLDLHAVRTFLFDRRTELKEEAAEEFAEERLVLEIDEDTTDDEIEAALPFVDMQVEAKNHRTAGLKVYRQDNTFVLWGDDFGWINEHSVGVADSVFFGDASGIENPWAALQTYHKAA